MNDEKIKQLLDEADEAFWTAGVDVSISGVSAEGRGFLDAVHRKARRQSQRRVIYRYAASVIILAAVATGITTVVNTHRPRQAAESPEAMLARANSCAEAALDLVSKAMEGQESTMRLAEAYSDNFKDQLELETDKTAFILLSQADIMYNKLGSKEIAVQTYNRIIRLFPENRWAQTAQERLAEMENNQSI